MTRFVEVAVALPVRGTFHYTVPPALGERRLIGARVLAPFGNRGVSGVVVGEADAAPEGVRQMRAIDRLLEGPAISPEMLSLCLWVADYYEAAPGEVIKAALPVGSSVKAAQVVELTEAGASALEKGALPRAERDLLASLARAGGAVRQRALVEKGARLAEIEAADRQGWVRVTRGGTSRVRLRTVRAAKLARPLTDDDRAKLARAVVRRAVVDALIAAGGEADVAALAALIPRAADHLRALVRAGFVELSQRIVAPGELGGAGRAEPEMAGARAVELNAAQAGALDAILGALGAGEFRPFLLHGVTGSGKTEVYLRAIAEVIAQGRSAIVLVPEISLTPQLAARFCARFGDRVAVLHSGLSDRERFDEWHRLRGGSARIALGARSAIFAPVSELGIIVVDEEHDSSFKQEEGVRYNARHVALVRAQRAGAVCVLGSATPSLESVQLATQGRLVRLQLPERATPRPLPAVELIDLRRFQPDASSFLTAPLATAVEQTLASGEQTILFLNRRGFNTFVLCVKCGHAFRCPACALSLTYHQSRDALLCHYCDHSERASDDCGSCGAKASVSRRGLGTERVAEAVSARFPGARVGRLDRDVASGAKVGSVLRRMARREIDILVGTQMVTKGHDFPGVTLVGVLLADTGLSLPDFRASERTFQLLAQVAGRAGRGDRPGRVLIQSYRTEANAVASARDHDYERFCATELESRQQLGYPPFGHLAAVRIDGEDAAEVERTARRLAARAIASIPLCGGEITVLGPSEAPLSRLKGRTRWHIWLRAPERPPLRRMVRAIAEGEDSAPGIRVLLDVDPISAL